jgi:hypothetical protein
MIFTSQKKCNKTIPMRLFQRKLCIKSKNGNYVTIMVFSEREEAGACCVIFS